MSLHYHDTQITPQELDHIRNVCQDVRKRLINKTDRTDWEEQLLTSSNCSLIWVGHVKSSLWRTWKSLPDGDMTKESYRDHTWTWDDSDIYGPQEESLLNDTV